jgi:hypothetical protein
MRLILMVDSIVPNSAPLPEAAQAAMSEIRQSMHRQGLQVEDLALAVGVSAAHLRSCLAGKRRLSPLNFVIACRAAGLEFTLAAAALDGIVAGTSHLRAAKAAREYECFYCGSKIRRQEEYVRLSPSSLGLSALTQHFCRSCSGSARWLSGAGKPRVDKASPIRDDRQLLLPLASHVKPTCVQLIDITGTLAAKILAHPAEIFGLSSPQFEEFVLDRLIAMGMEARPVGGGTYRRDGGVDIIFTPQRSFAFPFIGAVQVKHRQDPSRRIGPEPLRELMGVMAAQRLFSAGMIVTNTTFTPDAKDFAARAGATLRLRDFHDLMRWVADDFLDDAEWREMPSRIELCDGVWIDLG